MNAAMDIPVTPSQRSLLFIQEAVSRKDLYNISFRLVFNGPIDIHATRGSLNRLVRVQPTLRTRFDTTGGELHAHIVSAVPALLEIVRVGCGRRSWKTKARQPRRMKSGPVRTPVNFGGL
jgi:hypothetical protein